VYVTEWIIEPQHDEHAKAFRWNGYIKGLRLEERAQAVRDGADAIIARHRNGKLRKCWSHKVEEVIRQAVTGN